MEVTSTGKDQVKRSKAIYRDKWKKYTVYVREMENKIFQA